MGLSLRLASLLGVVGLAFGPIGAQTPAPAASAQPPAPMPDYHPSMGDLMTMAVQPRHIKLGLAGARSNWAYAGYELAELRNAFTRIARTIPLYRAMDTATTIDAMTRAPLALLETAVKNADAKGFAAAYAQLTAACNACHKSQEHAMVVIQTPSAASFPDQDFAPARP